MREGLVADLPDDDKLRGGFTKGRTRPRGPSRPGPPSERTSLVTVELYTTNQGTAVKTG